MERDVEFSVTERKVKLADSDSAAAKQILDVRDLFCQALAWKHIYVSIKVALKYCQDIGLSPDSFHIPVFSVDDATLQRALQNALVYIRRCLDLHPDFSEGHLLLGDLYREASDAELAAIHFMMAYKTTSLVVAGVDRMPPKANAAFQLAILYEDQGRWGLAIHFYTVALSHSPIPQIREARIRRGQLYRRMGWAQRAAEDFAFFGKFDTFQPALPSLDFSLNATSGS